MNVHNETWLSKLISKKEVSPEISQEQNQINSIDAELRSLEEKLESNVFFTKEEKMTLEQEFNNLEAKKRELQKTLSSKKEASKEIQQEQESTKKEYVGEENFKLESIIKLGNGKKLLEDPMCDAILHTLEKANLIDEIEKGSQEGIKYTIQHDPASHEFVLKKTRLVEGGTKTSYQSFLLEDNSEKEKEQPNQQETSKTVQDPEQKIVQLEQQIAQLEQVIKNLQQEQRGITKERINGLPDYKKQVGQMLADKFEYGVKNPWAMIGYGVLAGLFGSFMVGYGVVGTGVKLGSIGYDTAKESLLKRFGNKNKEDLKKKNIQEEADKKKTPENKPNKPEETPKQTPEQTGEEKKIKILEKINGGTLEDKQKISWDEIKKSSLDKFLHPEKFTWEKKDKNNEKKNYSVGELTIEQYGPFTKKIHEQLKKVYDTMDYNETSNLDKNMTVEQFLDYAITNNLITE